MAPSRLTIMAKADFEIYNRARDTATGLDRLSQCSPALSADWGTPPPWDGPAASTVRDPRKILTSVLDILVRCRWD